MALTGRFSFRRTLLGRVSLIVEEEISTNWPLFGKSRPRRRWRHAVIMDLTHPGLRKILELRDQSGAVVEPSAASKMGARRLNDLLVSETAGWRYPSSNGSPPSTVST
jgi:hypothetical protein